MSRWIIRREVWENRYLYLAPLVVMAVTLFGSAIAIVNLAKRQVIPLKPLTFAPAPIMFVTLVVGAFYSLEALYGERRDRSVLFWKSLPLSDFTTVISKASIPFVVLPVFALVLCIAAQIILLLASVPVLTVNGGSPAELWSRLDFFGGVLVMAYGLGAHILWFAPIYGWLMLVSAWARRAPLLWALLPWIALLAVERAAFNTSYAGSMLRYRLSGALTEAFRSLDDHVDALSQLTPLRFLSSAGLWVGLLLTAAFLATAVRLRRQHEPI